MLTALDDDASQMKGFDALADDYITKPFSMPLVVKHIEAVLRRAEQGAGVETNILRYKDLTLDTDSFTVLVKDESVSLTIRESVSYTHLDVYKRQGNDKAILPGRMFHGLHTQISQLCLL